MQAGERIPLGRVAAVVDFQPGDPELIHKLDQAIHSFMALTKEQHYNYQEGVRYGASLSWDLTHQLTSIAVSTLASAAGALGATVEQIRLEAIPGEGNSLRLRLWVPGGEVEVLVGELSYRATRPTATEGFRAGVALHLTPAGARALWDYGDVVEASAKEVDFDDIPTEDFGGDS